MENKNPNWTCVLPGYGSRHCSINLKTGKYGGECTSAFCRKWLDKNAKKISDSLREVIINSENHKDEVTHWMPLPEPPKDLE